MSDDEREPLEQFIEVGLAWELVGLDEDGTVSTGYDGKVLHVDDDGVLRGWMRGPTPAPAQVDHIADAMVDRWQRWREKYGTKRTP